MNNIDFEKYISGKVKIDHICNMLVEDINANNKLEFLNKWKLFRQRYVNLENMNISKVWSALIVNKKTNWFEELPFNKSCRAVMYAAIKYYSDKNTYNKEILNICFNKMSIVAKSNVIKELENLRLFWSITFQEKDRIKCESYLSIITEIDSLYRYLKPQNPDKFLTLMIVEQGKEVQTKNMNESMSDNVFFNHVTVKLMENLIHFDKMGANKLNNKKDSESLNEIYTYFQKYYQYLKLEKKLIYLPEKNIKIIKNKI